MNTESPNEYSRRRAQSGPAGEPSPAASPPSYRPWKSFTCDEIGLEADAQAVGSSGSPEEEKNAMVFSKSMAFAGDALRSRARKRANGCGEHAFHRRPAAEQDSSGLYSSG